MEVVVGLVVLVLLAVAWQWVKKTATQQVFSRHDHQEGRNLSNTVTTFTASGTPDAVLAAAADALAAAPLSRWEHRVYRTARSGDELRISFGTGWRPQFTARLTAAAESPGRVAGAYEVLELLTSDGVATTADQLRRCRETVLRAIASIDPATSFDDRYHEGRIL